MQRSIFSKYFVVCASLIIVSILTLGALFMVFASQYFKEDKYKLLSSNVVRAATAAELTLSSGSSLEELMDLYNAISKTIAADFFLADSQGNVLACTEIAPCRHTQTLLSPNILKSLAKQKNYFEMGRLGGIYTEAQYSVGMPVEGNGNVIAYVFASTPASAPLKTFLTEMLKMFLISAFTVLCLTFIIVYFISLKMVNPLRQMSVAAQRFGRGEFDTRLEISSYDEMGQLAMALNNMAQSLSTLETMRRSFIANVSHELKTPMTSMAGFVDGILDGTISPDKHRHYLRIVSDETHRLARVVRTMLNLSRIEAGEMTINASPINIVDTICQTVFTFEQQIDKKKITIRGLDHDKVVVVADGELIHQVVYNLTENAVKFVNDGGYIEFSFSHDAGQTYIGIKNSGAGLSKEEIPRLFDRFYKTDKSRGLDKNGVGLGLFIVRSIVNLHGGDIIVRSVQGEYSEFVFSIASTKPTIKIPTKFKKG